jgi:hypothetical protein
MPKAKAKMPNRKKIRKAQKEAGGNVLTALPDHGPHERWQHATKIFYAGEETEAPAARVLEECVLDTLRVTGVIAPALYVAGLQLRRSYQRAQLAPRQVGRYAGGTGEKLLYREFVRSPSEEEAYQEWRAALLAVGVQHSMVLVEVCCVNAPPRAVLLVRLCDGLQRLYDFYRRARLKEYSPK